MDEQITPIVEEHHAHAHTSHEHHATYAIHPSQLTPMQRVQQKIWDNRKTLLILLILFLFATGLRANLVHFEGNYLFEPDASYHARLVEYLVTQGSIPQPDPLNYYQIPGGIPSQPASLYHVINAATYEIVAFGQPYNKELLLFIVQFLPALFGAFIALAMYFLGKEVFNSKRAGFIAAFIAAVTPAFIYRTMAGAQGDNSLGFLWMVVGFLFFIRAVKTKTLTKMDILNTVLAGIFFGAMVMTWDVYLLIPFIIIPYFIAGIIFIAAESEHATVQKSQVIHFAIKVLGSLVVMSAFFFIPFTNVFIRSKVFWLFGIAAQIAGATRIDAGLITLGIIILTLVGVAIAYFISNAGKDTKKLFETLVILMLIVSILATIGLFIVENDFFYPDRTSIGSMVGEESIGNSFFGTKYNALIVLPWAALILIPIGIYLMRKEGSSHTQLLFFFWILITLFMAWYKLKYTFYFGLAFAPAAAAVGYIIYELLKRFNIERGLEGRATMIAFAFILILGVGAAAVFVPDYAPFPNQDTRLIGLIDWIDANTPQGAKFFNWWNDGHVLTLSTERRFSIDNRNEGNSNLLFSKFATTADTNEAYDIAAHQMGADYIYLQTDYIYALPTFEYYVVDKVNPAVTQKYTKGSYFVTNCSDAGSILDCGGNQIPKTEITKVSTVWKSTPDAFPDGATPQYYYYNNGQLLVLNQAVNTTNLAKVLLDAPETKQYYDLVYSNAGTRVYKIKK